MVPLQPSEFDDCSQCASTFILVWRRDVPIDASAQANDGGGHLEVLLVPHFDLPVLARADHECPDTRERGRAHRPKSTLPSWETLDGEWQVHLAFHSISMAYPLWAGTDTAYLLARRMSHRRNVPSRAEDSSSGCER